MVAAFVFPWLDEARRAGWIQRWSAQLLHILAVRLEVEGMPSAAATPFLLISNHVSWLDPFLINAIRPVRFIAKSEVARWPVIGWLAKRAGTLFVIRSRRHHTAQINQQVVAAMQKGAVFAVFPEGTTTDGSVVLPFHASLLQPAFEGRALLIPVALRYLRADDSLCTEAAYDGDKSVLDTLRAMMTLSLIRVQLKFLAPISCTDYPHRRELARAAEHAIASALYLAASSTHTETTAGPRAATR
jgi:1-acyl-sn-glycerol-3-phosphate acyltransferase